MVTYPQDLAQTPGKSALVPMLPRHTGSSAVPQAVKRKRKRAIRDEHHQC
jgi:hypothetical protein